MSASLVSQLRRRGMIHDTTPGLEELFESQPTAGYLGIDATASSLHVGNLAALRCLEYIRRQGHPFYIILGGATTMVGDPSGKGEERQLMRVEEIEANRQAIQGQVERLFPGGEGGQVSVLNNYDWLKEFSMLSFLREVGKHLTVSNLLGKEAVRTRLEAGISFAEFSYPLLQAYDFCYLHTHHGVRYQLGGADQWGNITAGIELARKKTGAELFGLTLPLLVKADGKKFGKSEQGTVWLSAELTSPYAFYQFWLNLPDEEAHTCLLRMTDHPEEQIETWRRLHASRPEGRLLQRELAHSCTSFVHGAELTRQAEEASLVLFGARPAEALDQLAAPLREELLAGIPQIQVEKASVRPDLTLLDLVTTLAGGVLFSSRREAREVMAAGGLMIDQVRCQEPSALLPASWLERPYLLVQKGRKQRYLFCWR